MSGLSTKKCLICNTEYQTKFTFQKYCSDTCNSKACYHRNKLKYKSSRRLYRENNKVKIAKDVLRWQQENKEKIRLKRQQPLNHLAANLRSRLSKAISRKQIECSAVTDLGCSLEELKKHLETQFKSGMSWDNYGDWHIDHIVPLASAQNEAEIKKLCHFTNLQPLWAEENLSKGDTHGLFDQKMSDL